MHWSKPTFFMIRERSWWLSNRKNWAILNTRVLMVKFLTQPVRIACIRAIPALVVDLNLRLPSWLRWIKLLDTVWNCSLSPMTFSISLPMVLKRTIGLNDLGESYDFLLGLGITIVVEVLKCNGQYPKLMHALAIQTKVSRHSMSSKIVLRWFHESLSGPGAEELLQLDNRNLNSSLENSGQGTMDLLLNSSRIDVSTWRLLAMLKVEWRAHHKSLISIHCWPLYLIVSIASNFFLLTQFISSHSPCLLLVISWILILKKDCFVDLTLFLKTFQFSQLLNNWYMIKVLLHSSFHQLLDCFVILIHLEFAFQMRSKVKASDVVVSSSLKELTKSSALMLLIACMTFSMNLDSSLLFFAMENLNKSIYSSVMLIITINSAWSEESHESGRMEWLLSCFKLLRRNIQSLGPPLWGTLLKLQEVFSKELSPTY